MDFELGRLPGDEAENALDSGYGGVHVEIDVVAARGQSASTTGFRIVCERRRACQ
jgi:hypothetical protein